LRAAGDGRAQRSEVRKAGMVGNYDLALDDGAFSTEPLGCFGERAVLRGPIMASAGEDPNAATIHDDLRAVPVELSPRESIRPLAAGCPQARASSAL
jgi:hypothetical protein